MCVIALGLKGLTFRELGGGFECFLLCFEVSGVEDVAILFILNARIVLLNLRTGFENLLSTHQPLTATRVGGSLSNLLSIHQRYMAGLKIATPEGADANAYQLLNAETQAREHLAYLALQALLQHDTSAAGTEAGYVLGLSLPFGDAHALQQLNQHAAVESLVECNPVFFFNATGGVTDALAKGAVVGENEQALTIGIQAADVVGVAILSGQ